MKTAMVIGGASCVYDDVAKYRGPIDGIVACNEIGIDWPDDLVAWATLHPDKFVTEKWYQRRVVNKPQIFGQYMPKGMEDKLPLSVTPYQFTKGGSSGSSGLFAAKVALVDLKFDRVVLCGIPIEPLEHFNGRTSWMPTPQGRSSCNGFRNGWLSTPKEYRDKMRSMSGWTRALLGGEF